MFWFIISLLVAIEVYREQYYYNAEFENECKRDNKEDIYIVIDILTPTFYCFILPFWLFASEYVKFTSLLSIHYFLQTIFWIVCCKRYWSRDKHKKNWYVSYVIIIVFSFLLFILFFCLSDFPKLINRILI